MTEPEICHQVSNENYKMICLPATPSFGPHCWLVRFVGSESIAIETIACVNLPTTGENDKRPSGIALELIYAHNYLFTLFYYYKICSV